jgi:hypothetical protein
VSSGFCVFGVYLFPQCWVVLIEPNKIFPQAGVVDLDLVKHSVDVIGLVPGDQGPDDTGHSVHGRAHSLLGTETALDHAPFMESKGGVIGAGGLGTKIEHGSFLVIASCSQSCFLERSSGFDPLRTTGPLSRQSLTGIKSGESPGTQHQSGGGHNGYSSDAVEQTDLACGRDTFWARFFHFRLSLLRISAQSLIDVRQPFLEQLELINQKNQGSRVMVLARAGYRALGQPAPRPLFTLAKDNA